MFSALLSFLGRLKLQAKSRISAGEMRITVVDRKTMVSGPKTVILVK